MNFKETKKVWLLNDSDNPIFGKSDDYQMITSGKGFYDKHEPKQKGFCLTGYISKEDAKLIIKAPELLDMLQNLVDLPRQDMDALRADIKKLIKSIYEETV